MASPVATLTDADIDRAGPRPLTDADMAAHEKAPQQQPGFWNRFIHAANPLNLATAFGSALNSVANPGAGIAAAAEAAGRVGEEGGGPVRAALAATPLGGVSEDVAHGNYKGAAGTLAGTAALGAATGLTGENADVVRAAAPDAAIGLGKVAGSGAVVASRLPGSWLGYMGVRSGLRQLKSAVAKGKEAYQSRYDATGENEPFAGEPGPAATPKEGEAAGPDTETLDGIAQSLGGSKFKNLSDAHKKIALDLAEKLKSQAPGSAPEAPPPYTPRPMSSYGVQPEATPAPQATAPAQALPGNTPGLPPRIPRGPVSNRLRVMGQIPESAAPDLDLAAPALPVTGVRPAPGTPAGPVQPPIVGQPAPQVQAAAADAPGPQLMAVAQPSVRALVDGLPKASHLLDWLKEHGETLDDHEATGLRVQSNEETSTKPGDELRPSSAWVDGERTDEELPGTAAFRLPYKPVSKMTEADLQPILDGMRRWGYKVGDNDRLALIAGDGSWDGDMPETNATAIRNAKLIDAFNPKTAKPVTQPTPAEMAAPFKVDQAAEQAAQNRSALMGAEKHMGNRKNAAQGIADYAKTKGYDDPAVMEVAQPEHWRAVARAAGYGDVSDQTIAAAKALLTKK